MKILLAFLLLPGLAAAQTPTVNEPATTSTLLPAAGAAAATGGALGYWIGSEWRFLGSSPARALQREAPLLGVTLGGLSAAAAACLTTDDPRVTTKRCLDGAVIGTVPAVVIAGAVAYVAPRKLRKWIAPLVYGLLEGGVTAWNSARD